MTGFLLRAGARVSANNANFGTAIDYAVSRSSTAVLVEILAFLEQQDDDRLALGAALALQEGQEHTPLHTACSLGKLRY